MKKIPIFELNQAGRVCSLISENFSDVIRFTYGNKNYPTKKSVVFIEYIGLDLAVLDTLKDLSSKSSQKFFLVIDDTYEGLLSKKILEKHIKYIESLNEVIDEFIILSANKSLYNEMLNLGYEKNFIYFNAHLYLSKYDGIDVQNSIVSESDLLRKKKFLCLNRQERLHRIQVVDHLCQTKQLRHGYISCPLSDYKLAFENKLDSDYQGKVLFFDDALLNYKFTIEQKNRLSSILPLELDVPDEMHKSLRNEMPDTKAYFEESYFSIITEGDFYRTDDRQMFTEKILKAFIYKHPFIVVGLPGTLSLLREQGFLTFPQIINEAYDTIEDDTERLNACLQEIDKLLSLNIHELKDLYDSVKPILEHNRKLVMQYNSMPAPSLLVNIIQQWFYNLND